MKFKALRIQLICFVVMILVSGMVFEAFSAHPPHLKVNGKSYFQHGWLIENGGPILMESTPWKINELADEANDWYETWSEQGFSSCTPYSIWSNDKGPYNWYHMTHAKAAENNGMLMMPEINRNAIMGDNYSAIQDQVNLIKDYPGLLGWYILDEPTQWGVPKSALVNHYNNIKTTDPDHPVMLHLSSGPDPSDYLPGTCDILSSHNYPIGYHDAEFGSPMWNVPIRTREGVQAVLDYDLDAYIDFPQAHYWEIGGSPAHRSPTAAEGRYLTYSAVTAGARGLMHYVWNRVDNTTYRDVDLPAIAAELNYLAPAILSDSNEITVVSTRDSDTTGHGVEDVIHLFGRGVDGGVLIAVNNTASTLSNVNFTLTGPTLGKLHSGTTNIPVLFESRNVQLQPTGDPSIWTVSDNFGPFAVHVYQLYDMSLYDDFGELAESNLKWTKDAGDGGQVFLETESVDGDNPAYPNWYTIIDLSDTSQATHWARLISDSNFSIAAGSDFIIRWRQRWDSYQPNSYYGGVSITSTDYTVAYIDAGVQNSAASGSAAEGRFYLDTWHNRSEPMNGLEWTSHELIVSTAGVTHNAWLNDGWEDAPWWTYTDTGLAEGDYSFRFYVWGEGGSIGEDNVATNRGILNVDDVYTRPAIGNCALTQSLGQGIDGDANGDCRVDLKDFAVFASGWTECNDPETCP